MTRSVVKELKDNTNNVFVFPEKTRYKPETVLPYVPDILPDGPDWMAQIRQKSHDRLKNLGLPTSKLERWKYTDLPKGLRKMSLTPAKSNYTIHSGEKACSTLSKAPAKLRDALNRQFAGENKYKDMMLADHAAVLATEGILFTATEDKAVDNPVDNYVDISFGGFEDDLQVERMIVYVESGAQMILIERHQGEGAYWKNTLTQIVLEEGATLRHYKIQNDAPEAINTATTEAHIAENAQYKAFTLTEGAGLSRNQIHAVIHGENADCTLNGINLLSSSQLGDTTITIEHQKPGCTSNQFYRTLLDDKAHGVFQGKVHVHREAQQTDGYQLSNAIMLSERAEMDTKPELEIYADDVKCSHGATTGTLEEEPLFYMRARGIDEYKARQLLMQSFLAEVIEAMGDETLTNLVLDYIHAWLKTHMSSK